MARFMILFVFIFLGAPWQMDALRKNAMSFTTDHSSLKGTGWDGTGRDGQMNADPSDTPSSASAFQHGVKPWNRVPTMINGTMYSDGIGTIYSDGIIHSSRTNHPTALLERDLRPGRTNKTKVRGNILVIIDMQRDYADGETAASGNPITGGSPTIPRAMTNINRLKARGGWHLIVYTKDWLAPCKGFCAAGSQGAQLLEEIQPGSAGVEERYTLLFTKDADDAFNLMAPVAPEVDVDSPARRSFDDKRHFDIVAEDDSAAPLTEVLDRMLFERSSYLTLTGTQTNRCVMKSAMHAVQFGYSVTVPLAATAGGEENMWSPGPCPGGDCGGGADFLVPTIPCLPASGANKPCSPPERAAWRRSIYTGFHGGPAWDDVAGYLREAGVAVQ